MPHQVNVVSAARSNEDFRRVLFTGERSQLVVMTIPPGGEVGDERHDHVEQTLFCLSGNGTAILDGARSPFAPGDAVVVTPGTRHNFLNTGTEPLRIAAQVDMPVSLDASATTDPDGHALAFRWFYYPEAGTGIPGQPVFATRLPRPAAPGAPPPARVTVANTDRPQAVVTPKLAGIAHVILAVEDGGTPRLTSYRRVILEIRAAAP